MEPSPGSALEKASYLIVDADSLFFDHLAVLVNFSGAVANALENNLSSPWNYKLPVENPRDSSKNRPDSPQNEDIADSDLSSDSHLLRVTIKSILEAETLTEDLVEGCLSVLKSILVKPELSGNPKLTSLCETFNNCTLFSLSVKDGRVSREQYRVWTDLTTQNLLNFLFDLLLLGWHQSFYLGLIRQNENFPEGKEYYLGISDLFEPLERRRFIFLSSFPSTLKGLLSIQGLLPDMSDKCIMAESMDTVPRLELELASKSFQVLSNNLTFIHTTSRFICEKFCVGAYVTLRHFEPPPSHPYFTNLLILLSSKVDLTSSLDPSTLSGPVACFLQLRTPVRLSGEVFKGHGRGLLMLGIPTANLRCDGVPHLLTGVYFGIARVEGNSEISSDTRVQTILSIGFNPHFFDENYSIEAYLYREFRDPLVGQTVHLEIHGYLRTDSKFKSLEVLAQAIQSDLHLHKIIFNAFHS